MSIAYSSAARRCPLPTRSAKLGPKPGESRRNHFQHGTPASVRSMRYNCLARSFEDGLPVQQMPFPQLKPQGKTGTANILRKIRICASILICLYLGLGLAFHLKWKSALEACREMRRAQGEFVEPEILGGVLGLALDVTNWPVYARATVYHDGTPFATPCTHRRSTNGASGEEGLVK